MHKAFALSGRRDGDESQKNVPEDANADRTNRMKRFMNKETKN
jgi:hypothetical protein